VWVIQPGRGWPDLYASRTSAGEVWKCCVTPNDGIEDGPPDCDEVTINTPPTQPTAVVTPDDPSPTTDDWLHCEASGSTDPDGDNVTHRYQWYRRRPADEHGSAMAGRTWRYLAPCRTWPGEDWWCVVTPTDGIENGDRGGSNPVTIGGTIVPVVTPENPTTDDGLHCEVPGTADPDRQYKYQWYRKRLADEHGTAMAGRTWRNLAPCCTKPLDEWWCVVMPPEGVDGADAVPSNHVTIINRAPTKPTVRISPIPAYTDEDLHCSALGSTDPDGDTVMYQYQWYKDDLIQPRRIWPNLSSSRTSVDEIWKCVVTPTDGMDDGPSASFSVIIRARTRASAVVIGSLSAQPTALGAQVAFALSGESKVTAEVLNIAGRPVQVLVADRPMAAGAKTLVWAGRNASGARVPSGVYLVRITAGDEAGSKSQALATVRIGR